MKEKDITEEMLEFKEATRHIRNTYFAYSPYPWSPETDDAYLSIERALLRVLVLDPHGAGDLADSYRSCVSANILIKPTPPLTKMPIQFGHKNPNGNTVWELETMIDVDASTQFGFYDFFNWDCFGQVDLPFVRVQEFSPVGKKSTGRRLALIQQTHCKFMLVTRPGHKTQHPQRYRKVHRTSSPIKAQV